ncbi:MAG TPA: SPOR domain-containing protein [Spirochaetota bacterium]|nr:SPOR domain-containing protein [Spirochaetota bacterium]HPI87873.1 SPOR domain-containing protein [Spirochaetota bacterium]HPR47395.1 SPOR domain-containing protein [Spirochaetota bacterium]
MEHFEGHEQQVKQKNVYLVHLDTPRIILISAVIIGIITVSFLVGMNFVKTSGEVTPAASDSLFLNDGKNTAVFDGAIPAPPHREDDTERDLADNSLPRFDEGVKTEDTTAMTAQNTQPEVITSETIKEIIPPAVKPKPAPKKVAKATIRARKENRTVKHARKKERAIEAASPAKKKSSVSIVAAADSSIRKNDAGSPAYAVQIASYDRQSRALSESRRLQEMHYDTYVDASDVNGRQFYRVRIGPVSTKQSAERILRDVQSLERYAESYIVRE